MAIVREFGNELQTVIGPLRQREVAEMTGISQPYINQMLNGKVPSLEMLTRLANGLRLEPSKRARLFAQAGYDDPFRPADGMALGEMLTDEEREVLRRLRTLEPEPRQAFQRFLETFVPSWTSTRPSRPSGVGGLAPL